MWKVIGFIIEAFIVGYCLWMVFKPAPDMKDLAWLGAMCLITLITCESKLKRIEEKLNK